MKMDRHGASAPRDDGLEIKERDIMKTISASLKNHLQQDVTTLATCWKITRRDGTVMGFTDHDKNLAVSGVNYLAATGFTPTSIESSSSLSVDNLDVEGVLDSSAITEEDLLAGRYDFAQVDVFMVNHADVSQGTLSLRTGWLGEISVKGSQFVAEIRGIAQHLSQSVGALYAPACRASLGDSRCKVALVPHTKTGTVTAVNGAGIFTDGTRTDVAGYFAGGVVTFTSGDNVGLSMEVKEFAAGKFILALALPHAIAVGDGYSAIAGCDKRLETCIGRFGNALNFRGEPHVPGSDRLFETAATRSK